MTTAAPPDGCGCRARRPAVWRSRPTSSAATRRWRVWRRRLAAGLLAGLSVGFVADPQADEWVAPLRRGDLPLVKRLNAEVREVSLVQWPAFKSAGVDGVHLRTKVAERRHVESTMAIASAKRTMAEVAEVLARRTR